MSAGRCTAAASSRSLPTGLAEMGDGLTQRTFYEVRLAVLRDTLESVDDSEERIAQRLGIAAVLMDLARWKECEEQQRQGRGGKSAHAARVNSTAVPSGVDSKGVRGCTVPSPWLRHRPA